MQDEKHYGPTLRVSEEIHSEKYRAKGETFKQGCARWANATKDNDEHFKQIYQLALEQKFLGAGRTQAALGAPKAVTPYNCFVSGTIGDSMEDIMDKLKEAALTLKLGGGIGYDFSTLRPRKATIRSLDTGSSGPISFMEVYNAMCGTIMSAGHRRGAQMGVLRVDHPDIMEFIKAKNNSGSLTNFNISVGITDAFMKAVKEKATFDLVFEGKVYDTVNAEALWNEILRSTWDWAEPGVLFIDRMNQKNNLWYCETITATNPCGEQPLPPYGACLLGSFNLVKYLFTAVNGDKAFDYDAFKRDIPPVVRAMDNIVDRAIYPLPAQRESALSKRRMGLGVTGVANAIEALGYPYGSPTFILVLEAILKTLRDTAYWASVQLAMEKGPFPLFDADKYLESDFAKTLPSYLREMIKAYGIRNSHLLSIAPTGTISLSADNVSSGIEPVVQYEYTRRMFKNNELQEEVVSDYGYRVFGVRGRTIKDVTVDQHLNVLITASRYVDSACSKTCNVDSSVTWDQFKDIYMKAYDGGASGCTTFRDAGKRAGIFSSSKDEEVAETKDEQPAFDFTEGAACYIDPVTRIKTCE